MRILIDADGSPVVDEAIRAAHDNGLEAVILCDTAHVYERKGVRTVTVSQGADSVDFKIVNMIEPGDIVVTQDYGLAAMCMARRARVIDQNGRVYSEHNIDGLLLQRHENKKLMRSGLRPKAIKKRTARQDAAFVYAISALIKGEPYDRTL